MVSKFAAAIKANLFVRGITQATLAAELEVQENTVSRWVSDLCLPDKESSAALKIYMSWDDSKFLRLVEDWFENNDLKTTYRIAGPAFVREAYDDDYKTFLRDLIKIDYETVEGLDQLTEGTEEQWAPIFKQFPQTWRLITFKNEIVGYWHCPLLKEPYFEKVRSGNLQDFELHPSMLDIPLMPGNYLGHFTIFTITPDHHNTKAYDCLRRSLTKMIEELAENDRYFSAISAHAYTNMGKKLCEVLGMKEDGEINSPSGDKIQKYLLRGKDFNQSSLGRRSSVGRKY